MEILNELGETIVSTPEEKTKLDNYVKNIMAFKPILARIFKETVAECIEMSYDEIERCIEGSIDISVIGLDPGMTNPQKIEGGQQEDTVNGEGKITYDIRTVLRIPKESVGVKLLIDVEMQKDDTPGYEIVERAIFYCSRMISAQLSTEFTNKTTDKIKYSNIKKVYSIWICTEAPDIRANTIERYTIHREQYPYEIKAGESIPRYDLMEAIIVNVSKNHKKDTDSKLLSMLTDLFNENIDGKSKVKLLKENYGIPTTVKIEREVLEMTMYTANIYRKGEEHGIQTGIQQGKRQQLIELAKKGLLSIVDASVEAGMTMAEFEALLKQQTVK